MHYRAAFKSKPAGTSPLASGSVASNIPIQPLKGPRRPIDELVASFAGLEIQPAPPLIEGTQPDPCYISELPNELLAHILMEVAIADVGDFARMAQVCKRLAYLVLADDLIWRRVCLGDEYGFTAMHHQFSTPISWKYPRSPPSLSQIDARVAENREMAQLLHMRRQYGPLWRDMFRHRPRIRFNGCYISTVNYSRSGEAGANQVTWGSPVHIVTYFRYLRFFRDGTVISLLSMHPPKDVIYHLTPELVELHRGGNNLTLPSAEMKRALKGRWRLSSADEGQQPDWQLREETIGALAGSSGVGEGCLYVETEGVGHYKYVLEFEMRSQGKGGANNKLAWRQFRSYHPVTDDWAEFTLKHDKPFFFSRVKSYGAGLRAGVDGGIAIEGAQQAQ